MRNKYYENLNLDIRNIYSVELKYNLLNFLSCKIKNVKMKKNYLLLFS